MKSLKGQLLIASRELQDANFFRTVVLLVQHGEAGALGLVLNRAMGATIDQVWNQVSQAPCASTVPLFQGGPVQGPLMALHGNAELSDSEVSSGLFLTTDRDRLEQLMGEGTLPLKLFAGYAGWAGGQLENEMQAGGWLLVKARPEQVFGPHEDLWMLLLRQVSGSALLSALNIKHVPNDPNLN